MYEPTWDGPIAGYATNQVANLHWRVARTMDWDEAKQEACLVFCRCRDRYRGKVTEPAHFMALFKTALERRFIDLARIDVRRRSEVPLPVTRDEDDNESPFEQVGELDNDGLLAVMVKQAPREVRMVLSLLLDAPSEIVEGALAGWRASGDRRAKHGGSKHVNRLLGLPEDQDTMAQVREYFSQ